MAFWIAAISAAKTLSGELAADNEENQIAENYGMQTAGFDHQVEVQQLTLQQQTAAMLENSTNAQVQVELSKDQVIANQEISAATAGASGDSVDATVRQSEINASRAAGNIEQGVQQEIAQQKQNMVDFGVAGELTKGRFDSATNEGAGLRIAGSFLEGFSMGV